MAWMATDRLISNIPTIKELSDEHKASILIEVFVKKCPGCKRGVDDGSVSLVCAVGIGEQMDLIVLVLPPL